MICFPTIHQSLPLGLSTGFQQLYSSAYRLVVAKHIRPLLDFSKRYRGFDIAARLHFPLKFHKCALKYTSTINNIRASPKVFPKALFRR
jgi:hypothetical protein